MWTVLIGLPPFLIGGFLLLIVLNDALFRGAPFSGGVALAGGVGALMVGLGYWLLFLGETVVLDFRTGRWKKARGLFLPTSREGDLSEFECVEMGRSVVRSHSEGGDTRAYFWVGLRAGAAEFDPPEDEEDAPETGEGPPPRKEEPFDLELDFCTDFLKARALAESLAKALKRPLADHTAKPPRLIPWTDLDRPVKEAGRRGVPLPPQPSAAKADIREGSLRFVVPMGKPKEAFLMLGGMTLLSGVLGGFFYYIAHGIAGGFFIKAFVWGVIVLPAAVALGALAAALWGGEIVEATPDRFRLTRRIGIFRWSSSLPAQEIEDVSLRHVDEEEDAKIVVRGDRKFIRFGAALSAPEKKWIAAAIGNFYYNALSGREDRR